MAAPDAKPAPHHKGRRLILCFDGTANLFDNFNTNVVRLMTLLKKDDYQNQMVYYQSGVGTYIHPSWVMPFMTKVAKIFADMVAWDIPHHIMGGYEFLMQNWLPGDKIYLFGFSRGAYTARALAGMLQKVGLLSRGNTEQIPFAYHMYKRADSEGWRMSGGFKKAFCNPVVIDFVGVWETVSSVGVFRDQYFPFTASNYHIRVFRHALSLDEHRSRFQPNLHHRTHHPMQSHPDNSLPEGGLLSQEEGIDEKDDNDDELCEDVKDGPTAEGSTDVEEVWFSGGHGDVGGGNVPDSSAHIIARIPLVWMLRETILSNTGIEFDDEALAAAGIDLSSVHPGQSPKPPVASLDKQYEGDVLAESFDMLVQFRAWWILEVLPFTGFRQGKGGVWEQEFTANMGRPRYIPPPAPPTKVHISVKERMVAQGKYKPRAQWMDHPEWVE